MKKHLIAFAIVALLVASPVVLADTYSLVDEKFLPLKNINDPIKHRNMPIVRYSFEQLDFLMWNSPQFLRRNTGKRVCESMQIMFGKVSDRCFNLPVTYRATLVPKTFVAPQLVTQSYASSPKQAAYSVQPAKKYHTPRPKRSLPRTGVVVVDPVYPPYGQIYRPYAWA